MQELRKNREIQLNQVLADMIKIWSCLIFIKLYSSALLHFEIQHNKIDNLKHLKITALFDK